MKKIIVFFFCSFLFAFGEPYHIGDKIGLNIKNLKKDEIKQGLKEWEIDKIEGKNKDYNVYFHTYTSGEKNIILGDKNLKINIVPLTESKDMEILTNFENLENTVVKKDYPYLGIGLGIIGIFLFLIGCLWFIIEYLHSPKYIFNKKLKKIDKNNWPEELSFIIREYIDRIYNSKFLYGEYTKVGILTEKDIQLLKKFDYLKFAPKKNGDFEEMKKEVLNLYKRIGEDKNV